MTKKHYILIAKAIKSQMDETNGDERRATSKLAVRLCNAFAADNERFNDGTFLTACGVENIY